MNHPKRKHSDPVCARSSLITCHHYTHDHSLNAAMPIQVTDMLAHRQPNWPTGHKPKFPTSQSPNIPPSLTSPNTTLLSLHRQRTRPCSSSLANPALPSWAPTNTVGISSPSSYSAHRAARSESVYALITASEYNEKKIWCHPEQKTRPPTAPLVPPATKRGNRRSPTTSPLLREGLTIEPVVRPNCINDDSTRYENTP